jgi:hypothetical protein
MDVILSIQFDLSFLHLIFIVFLALFLVVDPVGSAFTIDPLLSGLDLLQIALSGIRSLIKV